MGKTIVYAPYGKLRFALTVFALLLCQLSARPQVSVQQLWKTVLSSSNQRIVNIAIIGDSIACCIGPKEYSNVWTNQLRTYLGLRFRSHGSGLIPIGNNEGLSMNPQWTTEDSDGMIATVDFGPFQHGKGAFGSLFRLSGRVRLTVSGHAGDHVIVYYATSSDTEGGIKVSSGNLDLGVIEMARSSAFEARAASLVLPTDGRKHAITLEAANPKVNVYVYGVEFTSGVTGLSVHNVAHGYARSEAWGKDPSRQMVFLKQIPGKLDGAIIALGVNDAINGAGTTEEEYVRNMRSIVGTLLRMNPSMMIAIQDENSTAPGETARILPQRKIKAAEQRLAKTLGLGYISIAALWGSEKKAASKGYMAIDGVHPSDLGDRKLAEIMDNYFSIER